MHIHAPWLDTAMVGYLNSLLNSFPSRERRISGIWRKEGPGKLEIVSLQRHLVASVWHTVRLLLELSARQSLPFLPAWAKLLSYNSETKSRYCILTRKWNANVEAVWAFVDDGETRMRLDNDPLARIRRDHFIFNFFATCSFEIREKTGRREGRKRSCGVRERTC